MFTAIANLGTRQLKHRWNRPLADTDCGPGSSLGRFADAIAALSATLLDRRTCSLYAGVAQDPFPVPPLLLQRPLKG